MAAPTSVALSSSGEDAITRTLDVLQEQVTGSLIDLYDIPWTVDRIKEHDYQRIALQFPDELLHVSVPIYRALKSRLEPTRELYVLADTTYGSCCVDEVAAKHVDADVVVHYGHACLSPTSRLPVIYAFGHKPLDPVGCARALLKDSEVASKNPGEILLLAAVAYEHRAGAVADIVAKSVSGATKVTWNGIPRFALPQPSLPPQPSQPPNDTPDSTSKATEDISGETTRSRLIFYIGPESLSLTNILVTHAMDEVWSYNPETQETRQESVRTNRMLMRRYAIVQKARDADVFAILIGTLGVAQYLPMIKLVRDQLARAQKKTYTISVGKLNPAKLANFMEVECFVLIACPENSLIDSKEFLRPIVTPFELGIILDKQPQWTGRYVLDFGQVLQGSAEVGKESPVPDDEDNDSDQPEFSLSTGKYRQANRYGKDATPDPSGNATSLVTVSQDSTVARFMGSAAGEFLQNRSFRGLEQRLGQDEPSNLEQGRSGIARGYGELNEAAS